MFKKVLVTGAAGFIGYHLSKRLVEDGVEVVGIDRLSSYYSVELKKDRINNIVDKPNFTFEVMDLRDTSGIQKLFKENKFDVVVHLAAQAGVRYSLKDPYEYVSTNLMGFVNILEACKDNKIDHLVYASSSSVYGANTKMPLSPHDVVDHPLSVYAATKKSSEMMAHAYSNLYDLPATGVRFFTVYGPWGRPDLFLFLITKAIYDGTVIKIFNHGNMKRDFTYVDDVVEGLIRMMGKPPKGETDWEGDPSRSYCKHKVYNIGNSNPATLMDVVKIIEDTIGHEANKEFEGMQPGDVQMTYSDVSDLQRDFNFKPTTPLEIGIKKFVEWYKEYYKVNPPAEFYEKDYKYERS